MSDQLAAFLGTVVVGLVGFIWNKIRGEKQQSLADMIDGIVGQGIHLAVVTADSHPDDIRESVTRYVWLALLKAKVPRNATTEMLVSAAVEAAIHEALDDAHDRLVKIEAEKAMAAIKATIPKDIDAIGKPPTNPTVPRLDVAIEVTK